MRIIPPSFEILAMPDDGEALRLIETAGRTCYKSEPKHEATCLHCGAVTPWESADNGGDEPPSCAYCEGPVTESSSAPAFVRRIIDSGHHSVIEHVSASVRIVCDRGVTHELVRHRLASFSQESTRYCNYGSGKFGREITVIRPYFWEAGEREYTLWRRAMVAAESAYLGLLDAGATPQEARSVLPNSLKTEIVVTANFREWRHIFTLRTAKAAHPQMREIMLPLLAEFKRRIPIVFDDIGGEQE